MSEAVSSSNFASVSTGCIGRYSNNQLFRLGSRWLFRPGMVLILDCGGVLSDRQPKLPPPNFNLHQTAVDGAYPFVHSFIHKYGAKELVVLSRVNHPKPWHWVERFADAMGISPRQVYLVSDIRDKGPKSVELECTCFVEDRCDGAWYIATANARSGNLKKGYLFGKFGRATDNSWDQWFRRKVIEIPDKDWKKVAIDLDCYPGDDVWDYLCEHGPPRRAHAAARVDMAWRKQPKWRVKEQLPEEDKTEQATPAKKEDAQESRTEDATAPQEDTVVDYDASSSVSSESESESSEGTKTEDTKQVKTEKTSSNIQDKMKPMSADSAEAGKENKASPAMATSAATKTTEQNAAATAAAAAAKTESEKDRQPPPALTLTPGPAARANRDESPLDPPSVSLKGRNERLEEKVTELEKTVASLTAAASSGSNTSQAVLPKTNWGGGGHRPRSGWTERKIERSRRYQSGDTEKAKAIQTIHVVLCGICSKNQPGTYCKTMSCRKCCKDPACPQHA